jgi:hypothetical protein
MTPVEIIEEAWAASPDAAVEEIRKRLKDQGHDYSHSIIESFSPSIIRGSKRDMQVRKLFDSIQRQFYPKAKKAKKTA